jgi:hypothetical protein
MVSVSRCAQIFFTQLLLREHAAAVVAALQLKPGERERLGAYFTPLFSFPRASLAYRSRPSFMGRIGC